MGILYNRFTPGFTLLPYSDQSKIITYATYDNFDTNSSTWGTGDAPIRKTGTWYKDTDAQGFISFGSNYNSITNTSALGNAFTIYEVLKHINYPQYIVDDTYNLIINRGSQSSNEYLFSPYYSTGNYTYNCEVSGGKTSIGILQAIDQAHITAVSYEYNPSTRICSTKVFCNYRSSSIGPASTSYASIQGIQIAGTYITTRCYKFIAVVAENESKKYIGNYPIVDYNLEVLQAYFGIQDF